MYFWGKLFKRKQTHYVSLLSRGGLEMEQKVLNLKLFMRSILMPGVIKKVHIGLQFEYNISKHFSVFKTLFHSAHRTLKLIKNQRATTSYPSDCCRTHVRERRGSAHRTSLSERKLYRTWHFWDSTQYPQPHTKFQAL